MIRIPFASHVVILFSMLVLGVDSTAQELPLPVSELERSDPVDFAKEIMPILKQNCLACHHEKEAEGGLVLESIEAIVKGGDSGQGAVAKDVDASLVFTRAAGIEEPLMPPEDNSVGAKPLTAEQLGLLKLWIEQGATGSEMTASEKIDWQPIPESIRTIYALDISPDGQFAAIGRGNRVTVVDLASREEIAKLVDPSLSVGPVADVDLIQSIAISPDAQRIATGGFRTVRIWKQSVAAIAPDATPLAGASGLVSVKSDRSAAAMVNAIGDIEIWNLAENKRLHTLRGHRERVSGLVWAGASDRVFSCDPSGKIVLWQASTGTKTAEFDAASPLTHLDASHDGVHAAALDATGNVLLVRASGDGTKIEAVSGVGGEIADARAIALTAKPAPMLVVASEAGGVNLLGLSDGKSVRKIDHGAPVEALEVTADETLLVTGGRDGKTRVWKLADGSAVVTAEGDPQLRLVAAAASRDAARQKAAVARLNQKTGELEKLLAKEDEVLKKATEEHKKATEALAAEEKKRTDAVAAATATEGKIAAANADAAKAAKMIENANKLLTSAKASSAALAKEIEAQKPGLAAAQEAARKAQAQLAEITKAKQEAEAKAKQIGELIAAKQAAMTKANEEATKAQTEIDTATKMATTAKTASEAATKELEAKKKAVATAEEAKKKSQADVAKRNQALEAAKNAHQRATAAVPAHKEVIAAATRRQSFLDQQLTSVQATSTSAGNEVTDVAVNENGSKIATAHRDGSIRVYRASDGLPLLRYQSSMPGDQTRLVYSGDMIGASSSASRPTLWSTRVEWNLERTIGSIDDPSILSDRVTALDFRQDGASIAVGSGPPSRSGEVKVFAVDSGDLVRDFGEVHSDTVLGLEFSPDGRQLASSAADKTIRLLDIAEGKLIRSLEGHTHHVLDVAWQDDGQTIASASADKSIKIWNTETGEQRRTIGGFSKELTAVAFVQSTNQIVTACADGQLRLSDTSNGKALRTFNASGDFLFSLSVTPDGKQLLAGGQSGNARLWTLADGKLVYESK